ncbi:MAG: TlpA disulfide reductase family protein [Henriciella sp.]
MPRLVKYALPVMILGLVVAVSFALLSATSKGGNSGSLEKFAAGSLSKLDVSRAGELMSEATFEGPDGSETKLTDLKGRPILLNFWATWCGPCEREMPSLAALQKEKGGEDFQVIAISVDATEDRDYAIQRLQELTGGVLDFYFAPPENWEVVYETGARGFPTTVIYDAEGVELARLSGEAEWNSYEAVGLIDAITE